MPAKRLNQIPAYVFADLDKKIEHARACGEHILDLSQSDPDNGPPAEVEERLMEAVRAEGSHLYPSFEGLPKLRRALAARYRDRYGVALDPDEEVYILAGSKEGIAHLAMAFLDPGDVALVPDPAYPAYRVGTLLAGGVPHPMPLDAENHFLPDLQRIEQSVWERTRLMYLNYPNNPTGAVAPEPWLQEVVQLAQRRNFVLLYDAAYADITFGSYRSPSPLALPGAKGRVLEAFTFSKPFGMQGFRLGALLGDRDLMRAFATVETNLMAGVYTPIQEAGAFALDRLGEAYRHEVAARYHKRQALFLAALDEMRWPHTVPQATVYLWLPVGQGLDAQGMTDLLFEEAQIAVSPGTGFGPGGEGYIRISLTAPDETVAAAAQAFASLVKTHRLRPPTRNASRETVVAPR